MSPGHPFVNDHQIVFEDPGVLTREALEDALCEALDRGDDLVALVRWLALPYMTTSVDGVPSVRTPIFAGKDIFTGEALLTGPKLEALWHEIFGETEPPAPGRWVRCETCNAYNIETVHYAGFEPPTAAEREVGLEMLRMGYL